MRPPYPCRPGGLSLVIAALLTASLLACTSHAPTAHGAHGAHGADTALTPAPASVPRAGSRIVREAMDALWERDLRENLFLRLQKGLAIEELPDLSAEKADANATFARSLLAHLGAVDEAELGEDDRLSLGILRHELTAQVATHELCAWHFSGVTPYASPLPILHRAFTEHRFATPEDGQRYLRLLDQYPHRLGQMVEHLRGQLARGIVLPRAEIALVLPILGSYVREPEASLFQVSEARLAGLDEVVARALSTEVARRIRDEVNPALGNLAAFLAGPYEARAPEAVGLGQYPGGEACYRQLVRQLTTLDISPEEVHVLGLREVERIAAEMAEVRHRLGFEGSQEDFHQALRQDPRFRAESAEAIGERLSSYVAKIEPRIDELFSRTPRAPHGVERLDPTLEPGMTYGYYRPPTQADPRGIYYFNGADPGQRPLFWAQALIYHELVPGHHFQIALQSENESLHPWRQNYYTSAFGEGWAEYASSLGEELGLYEDPYELYGRLVHESFLASRLVVDTGMNHLGWSREEATVWMREHTLSSETEIATETLRYAVDLPGQALAYKIGAITLNRLREKAKAALGAAFDVREFHAVVLDSGNLPLGVLEGHIDRSIEEKREHPAPGGI